MTNFIQTGTLGDLKQDVLDALQGRTDVSDTQIANYAAKVLRELTESYPFEELRTTGPQFILTIGTSIYPITSWLNLGDDYSMPESFAIFVDFPTNTITTPIRYKNPSAIETLMASAVVGIPTWYTRFGQNFGLGPTPAQTYTTFLRYQAKHPFSKVSPTSLTEPIYLPTSWFDIAAYATAERIAIVKRWSDQAQYLHDRLYGDPEYINSLGRRGRPGLVAARTFQQERDQAYNSRNLNVVVSRYNPR